MKRLLVFVLIAAGIVSVSGQAPEQGPITQGPTFRTGVELIEVDVAVVDARGRPVDDLRAPEFTVRIDGQPRRVVSAELVKYDVEAARRETVAPIDTHFTTNLTPPNGRLIVIAVDQLGIAFGRARPILQTAAKFLDSLSPADRVSFVAYPEPGVYIDFTSDRIKLRQAMERIVGSQLRLIGKLNIGLYEAVQIIEESNEMVFETVVARECRGLRAGANLDNCIREVLSECATMVTGIRTATASSLAGLTDLLRRLAVIPGPKSLILLSEGMILDTPTQVDAISYEAARARVSVNVLMMDVPRDDITIAQMRPTATEDREMQMNGLRSLAAVSRGDIFNVVGTGENIFERLSSELSAHYLLGVEQAPGDGDPGTHRLDVQVNRRGVSVRSRRAFVLSASRIPRRGDPGEALSDILKSPFGVADLPLRVTTFARQDASGERVRLLLAADVGQPGMPAQQFDVGYALIDANGAVVASGGDRRALSPANANPAAMLEYLGEVVVDPGVYTLRLAVVDAEGRRGGVVREVNAWKLSGEEFALGDLMIGDIQNAAEARAMRPSVEPRVGTSLGAYVEFYSAGAAGLAGATVTFEIAREEDGAALVAGEGRVADGDRPTTKIASGVLSTALLPPGRYLVRARVARNGTVAGMLARPFILDGPAATATANAVVPPAPTLVLTGVQPFDAKLVMTREILGGMFDALEQQSPALRSALAEARAGRYSIAAVEALAAGEQTAAAFLKGLDWFAQGRMDQAAQQLQIAAGPRREFFPAAFFLGASFAAAGRDRDAAGVWQMAIGTEPRAPLAYTLFADARFRDGQPTSVIDVLRPAYERLPGDDEIGRRLATAYLITERYEEAIPVLDAYLSRNGTDQDMLFAAVFAQYQLTTRNRVTLSNADLDKLARYVRAYRGPSAPLLARYLETIRGN
jgi:VWFA-related protein